MSTGPYATLIRGGTLILPDGESGIRAEPGDLLMEGDRIARVGVVDDPPEGARVIYASGCAVLPGFVQTHVHLCQTLFRGIADELPLLTWLRERVWPLEAAHTPQSIRASARLAVAELLLSGTTAVQTMESVHHTGAVIEVLAESGMFAITGKCLMDDPATTPPELLQPTETALGEAVDLVELWDGSGRGRIRICLAPRFAVSCTDACMSEVAVLAKTGGWRVHTHASENRDEVTLVEQRTGRRNIHYLADIGLAGDHVGLAHCIWVDEDEVDTLATTGSHVLHCPGSNCMLGSGIAPVPLFLDRGVSVSLGADGAACNNTLDMFREMRLATMLQKSVHGPLAMPASTLLDMATRRGAQALGWGAEMGSLVPGSIANVLLVSLDGTHATPAPDPLSTLAYCCRSADIRAVWLAGEQVVSEGRLALWDEDEIRREARREARGLVERAGI
ncbi:MAG TPA: 5'-deoxyadenosine deaminase [Acidobacteriota bacterium]|nr:5'-deoxyadenosine deaminase [Acidobacteriota bacterium]